MDKMNFNAPVTGVKFFTNSKGVLVPVVVLDKEYTARKAKEEHSFDGITLHSYNDLKIKQIGRGAVIHIEFDEKLMPKITDVIKTAEAPKPPTNCIYCNSRIVHTPLGEALCVNHLCSAQGRTGIFKLIIGSSLEPLTTDGVIAIHKWLNSFPANSDVAEISYYYEFLKLFGQELNKVGQAQRKEELNRLFGKSGNYLYLHEISLKNALMKGLKPSIVWYTLSLPFNPDDMKKLENYDFNVGGTKGLPKLSKHGKSVVQVNLKHIELIFTETARFANK